MGKAVKWSVVMVTAMTVILGLQSASVLAGENGMQASFDVALGTSYLSGDTDYQIGGKVKWDNFPLEHIQFPISELKWPLDTFWVTLRGDVSWDRWRLGAKLEKNITDDPGDMEDRDWGIYPYPYSRWDRLDVYSETDTELDGLIFDINADFTFYRVPQWAFYAGLGYLYQNFDFDGRNTKQWQRDPITSDRYYVYVPGDTIDYEVTYKIPYLRLGTVFSYKDKTGKDKFQMEASAAYSPIADAEDEDNHLLRGKTNRSDTDGDAWIWAFYARYNFMPQWFLGLNFDYTTISTDGDSRATFTGADAVYNHVIDIELDSTQTSTTFEVGYEF